MNKIILSIIVISLLGLFSCNNAAEKSNGMKANVKISLTNIKQSSKIYVINIGAVKNTVVDSVLIDKNGIIDFDILLNQSPDLYIFQFSPSESIRLALSDNEEVKINILATPINSNYSISGSKDSELILEYSKFVQKHMSLHDSIYLNYRKYAGSDSLHYMKLKTDSLLKNNFVDTYESLKQMVLDNTNSLASLLGVYSKFGNSNILDIDYDYYVFEALSDSLINKYPNNTHAISLKTRVSQFMDKQFLIEERYQNLDKGGKFPFITLKSIDNSLYSIEKSVSKRKIVFLWKANTKSFYDFNIVLRKLSKEYKSDELQIIAISSEKDLLQWRNYVRMERMKWVNLIADENTEELINPKAEYSFAYVLDEDNNILARIKNAEQLQEYFKN